MSAPEINERQYDFQYLTDLELTCVYVAWQAAAGLDFPPGTQIKKGNFSLRILVLHHVAAALSLPSQVIC